MKAFPVITSLLFLFSCAQTGKNDRQGYDATVIHAPLEWDSLFNAGNAAGVAALYADDMISMPYDMASVNGVKAQEQGFKDLMQQNPGVQHHTVVDEILMDDSFAIERAHYTMLYPASANNKQVNESGRHVMCRKKINGKWKIAWEIWNKDKPLQ